MIRLLATILAASDSHESVCSLKDYAEAKIERGKYVRDIIRDARTLNRLALKTRNLIRTGENK